MQRIDVDAMLDELTVEQFEEWAAYWQIEPWDYRTVSASVSQHIAVTNSQRMCQAAGIEWTKEMAIPLDDFIVGTRPKKKVRRDRNR